MKSDLTNFWFSCKEVKEDLYGHGYVSCKFFISSMWPRLQKQGYDVATQRHFKSIANDCEGVGPFHVVDTNRHKGIAVMTFSHFIHLMWSPITTWVCNLATTESQPPPKPPESLAKNIAAVNTEMIGKIASLETELTIDDYVLYIQETLLDILGVEVALDVILHVVSPLQFSIELTRANAVHILYSPLCCKLVGQTMARLVRQSLMQTLTGMPAPNPIESQDEILLDVKKDLVHSLGQINGPPPEEADIVGPAQKKKRGKQDIEDNMSYKTKQVVYMIKNRIASMHMQNTVIGAATLMHDMLSRTRESQGDSVFTKTLDSAKEKVEDILVSRHSLQRHLLLMDAAMDRVAADRIMQLREEQRFTGVAIATDESPPSQPRFRGLRFQITVFYWGAYKPIEEWSTSQVPPLNLNTALADFCHCPGKKGIDVSRVLEKQLARMGMNPFDVVSCTGDGGGENEGMHGIHAHFENLNPGYVRRRCLPHIAWRAADQALDEAKLDYKNLASYFADGITWSRLRHLAVQPRGAGGLGLFRDGSQDRTAPIHRSYYRDSRLAR